MGKAVSLSLVSEAGAVTVRKVALYGVGGEQEESTLRLVLKGRFERQSTN